MSSVRYQFLKLIVSIALFAITILPMLYAIGWFASLMPKASGSVAFWLLAIAWFIGMAVAAHVITDKLAKRWSR